MLSHKLMMKTILKSFKEFRDFSLLDLKGFVFVSFFYTKGLKWFGVVLEGTGPGHPQASG